MAGGGGACRRLSGIVVRIPGSAQRRCLSSDSLVPGSRRSDNIIIIITGKRESCQWGASGSLDAEMEFVASDSEDSNLKVEVHRDSED
eukprot:1744259-Rhodomonas_salina.1